MITQPQIEKITELKSQGWIPSGQTLLAHVGAHPKTREYIQRYVNDSGHRAYVYPSGWVQFIV